VTKPLAACLALILAAAPAAAGLVAHKDRQLDFHFAWPALPQDVPRLEALLRQRAAAQDKQARGIAVEMREDDRQQGLEPAKHSYEEDWAVDASTPRLLGMHAATRYYRGGAHDGLEFHALVWDRKADRALRLADVFATSAPALQSLARDYCTRLKAEKKDRMGDDVDASFQCPALAGQRLTLLARAGHVRALEVLLDPYTAGSWAEGPYVIEVPIRPAVAAAVKPEYRASF
jgi:hypothetical protein